jgi:ABC-2 type transport system ATP-binding protein/lipopolysaccharide transport system ATP-binding protein
VIDSCTCTETDAVVVEHLNKTFMVRHMGSLKRALFGRGNAPTTPLRALDDVSFRIPHGQTVAVVGRNGSGKSTLLGILARVYKPTSGRAEVHGPGGGRPRIAPLLALGAGFHRELTGLENIDFYGAILGMTPREIEAKRPKILAFAELEDKADTVIRGWNDGARLRLGFSIAVHIDPDLLLVDEVLAVGDEAFQHKCFRLIAELQAAGTTILFVTHDLAVAERTAGRVLWMDAGRLVMDGAAPEVLPAYRQASG